MTSDRERPNTVPDEVARLLSEEGAEDRRALEQIWSATGRILDEEPTQDEYERMGRDLWPAIEREIRHSPRPAQPPQRMHAWRWPAVAASLALLLVGAVFYLTWPVTVTAPAGERLTVTLPDGSAVELNSGASLTYAGRSFGWLSRTTSLHGEAFFEVVPHRSVFIARTFNAEVRVLGTSFNVRAWPEDRRGETVVVLGSGKLQLSTRAAASRAVVLQPGQRSRVPVAGAGPSRPEEADVSEAIAWRSGRFVFVDQPLSTILEEMERRFDVHIAVESDEILDDRLTLAYDSPTGPEAILDDIASSYSRYAYRVLPHGYALYLP